jgi:malignant T-cell-amplified sequence
MFKKFNATEDIAGRQNVKSSVQRAMRAKIVETFPKLEPFMEEMIPKKSQLTLVKWYGCLIFVLTTKPRAYFSPDAGQ